jgi:hypothetical protein
MQKDIDYGVIPGTGKKPTLLKPGAEKLGVLFQLDVQLENEKIWDDNGHLTVISRATVWHIPSGSRVASGEGMCTTREGKYAFRQADRFCPSCGVAAIIKGKPEYGGGFVCFKKKGGCGAKYAADDRAILDQPVGQVANPNIADTYNTVDKMASKRARIDAVLAATGASALFTQDAEDLQPPATPPDLDPEPHPDVVVDDGLFPPPDDIPFGEPEPSHEDSFPNAVDHYEDENRQATIAADYAAGFIPPNGKYSERGAQGPLTLAEIAEVNPGWIKWARANVTSPDGFVEALRIFAEARGIA